MDPALAVLTFLHVLMFVYWLGGDLGAFVASGIVTDSRQPAAARVAAAGVLAQVDMAPRTALILALPTGVALGAAKGWVSVPGAALGLVTAGGLAWLAIAWLIHLRHAPPKALLRRIDLAIRWAAVAGLLAAPLALGWPLFMVAKAALLAGCVLCGLAVRAVLGPFGPAFAAMAKGDGGEEANRAISQSLGRARPFVVLIWVFLAAAAFLGLLTPR